MSSLITVARRCGRRVVAQFRCDYRRAQAGGGGCAGRPARARAPEIVAADTEALRARIRNAGAIFIGAHTRRRRSAIMLPAPTACCRPRGLRFSSGLGVLDFMKRTSLLKAARAVARSGSRDRSARRKARAPCALRGHSSQSKMSAPKSTPAGMKRRLVRGRSRRRINRPVEGR